MTIATQSLTLQPPQTDINTAIAKIAAKVISQVKQPLFAYPGIHFYLHADLSLVPLTIRTISRRDVAQNDLISLQQHYLFYMPPKTAAYHVVVVALDADDQPHCSIHQNPCYVNISWINLTNKNQKSAVIKSKFMPASQETSL